MYFYQGLLNNKGISKVSCPFFSGFCIVKWKSVIAGSIRIILKFKGGSTAGAGNLISGKTEPAFDKTSGIYNYAGSIRRNKKLLGVVRAGKDQLRKLVVFI